MTGNEWDHTDVVPESKPGRWSVRGHTSPPGSQNGQICGLPLSFAELAAVYQQIGAVLVGEGRALPAPTTEWMVYWTRGDGVKTRLVTHARGLGEAAEDAARFIAAEDPAGVITRMQEQVPRR